MSLSRDQFPTVRAAILAICGPEKYNTLIRQHSEAVQRGKLRFWQQQLLSDYIQQSSLPIDAMSLYLQVFHEAELVVVPEKPFVYPAAPKDALIFAVARSDLAKIQECFRLQPDVVELLASDDLPTWVMCEAGKHATPDVVRLLVDLECDLNQWDSNQFTGLGWAIANDRYEVAKTFLECRADPNKGVPLFKIFTASNPMSLAELLIRHGANPNQSCVICGRSTDLLSRSIDLDRLDLADYFKRLGVQSVGSGSSSNF